MKTLLVIVLISGLATTVAVAAPTKAQSKLFEVIANYNQLKSRLVAQPACYQKFNAAHPDAQKTDAIVTQYSDRSIVLGLNDALANFAIDKVATFNITLQSALNECLTKSIETNQQVAQKVIPILASVFATEIAKDRTGFLNGLIHNDASNIVVDAVNDCKTNFGGDANRWGNQIRSHKQFYKDHYKLSKY